VPGPLAGGSCRGTRPFRSMNKKKSKCDDHFDRSLTDNEVKEVEAAVNKAISANMDVTEAMVSKEVADRNFNLIRLPEGVETVRIVHIGDFDSCPCVGEHVDNTVEIGEYRMISHNFNGAVLRIRYKLGSPE
jgi:misacylated tRNA(Ala) deacylase